MDLSSLLTVEQIIPQMNATERWGAIVELVDLLVKVGKVKPEDHEVVLSALKQREETMSTGIGFSIAIPHASSDKRQRGGGRFRAFLDRDRVRFAGQRAGEIHRAVRGAARPVPDAPPHAGGDCQVVERPERCANRLGTVSKDAKEILAIFKSRGSSSR